MTNCRLIVPSCVISNMSTWKLGLIVVVCVVSAVEAQRSRQTSSNGGRSSSSSSTSARLTAPTTTPEPRFLSLPDPRKVSWLFCSFSISHLWTIELWAKRIFEGKNWIREAKAKLETQWAPDFPCFHLSPQFLQFVVSLAELLWPVTESSGPVPHSTPICHKILSSCSNSLSWVLSTGVQVSWVWRHFYLKKKKKKSGCGFKRSVRMN